MAGKLFDRERLRVWGFGNGGSSPRPVIKVIITAKNDHNVFAGKDINDDYVVIRLDDTQEIELGDVLSGDLAPNGEPSRAVENVTKGYRVRICLEGSKCRRGVAFEQLARTGSSSGIDAL